METAPLKSFATWARKELIREVNARIAVVLAPASAERVEQPQSVEALEKAVAAAGGGDKGRAAVADKVAYTWFNRIIALRFMDANGYTGVGVVSPQAGVETGQPEILAEAKRGNFEREVVVGKTRETVTGLLDGTRRSADAQGEAYALLLAEYCRHWNRAMPFMFEREGDFTELLIPGNLLADDSVPSRAVKVLTKDVCQDVEVIGWLYQFYISERKDEVFAGFKKNKKAGADEIPAATQLFTPHWIVRYLVENSLGRLWMLNRPTSHLVDQMQYYIAPVDEETEFLKISRPEELKVVDPACGSGHMLTYAFDLLFAIYEEEGYAPADIPSLILTNNLYGVEIDPRAGALAAFALTMKARAKQRTFFNKHAEPNVCVLDPISFTPAEVDFLLTRGGDKHAEAAFWNQFEQADTFGSLIRPDPELTVRLKQHIAQLDDDGDILLADTLDWAERVIEQAEYLRQRYHVAVTNPPYMILRNMGEPLATFVKSCFPQSPSDLWAAFIVRTRGMVASGGFAAMITMQKWMFGSSYRDLRQEVLSRGSIASLIQLGPGAFDSIGGEVVSTAAFVLVVDGVPGLVGEFLDLTLLSNEVGKRRLLELGVADASRRFRASVKQFELIPGLPVAYWIPERIAKSFEGKAAFGSRVELKSGVSTGDNSRFQRCWHEVSFGRIAPTGTPGSASKFRWTPCNSGGEPRRWYGNNTFVMDWEDAGLRIRQHPGAAPRNLEYQGREGITYTKNGGATFATRYSPSGFVFDDTGRMIFPRSVASIPEVLAFTNSVVAQLYLDIMSPGLSYTSTEIGNVPCLDVEASQIRYRVERAIEIARTDWNSRESSWGFDVPPVLRAHRESGSTLAVSCATSIWDGRALSAELRSLEAANNEFYSNLYGLEGMVNADVAEAQITLFCNPAFVVQNARTDGERDLRATQMLVADLVSYAVGCMFGRYSLDEPGLILADQGATVQDYLAKVPNPTFAPDRDNVIPVVDGDWFGDDIVARFRTFLRAAFGEQHFEENLRFVTESLGVRDIRDYFVRSFYKDHVQRYKKRPIYWLFSSPKGSFNALIYLHRYTPSTVSTVLNEYLREFTAKLSSSLQQQERLAAGGGTPRQQAAAQKEADRLRKVLLELEEYEHDVLYPLASRQLAIDLDDGVKANYPKFGTALKKIPGLEASDE